MHLQAQIGRIQAILSSRHQHINKSGFKLGSRDDFSPEMESIFLQQTPRRILYPLSSIFRGRRPGFWL
jgi:hypothetical protein